MDLQGAIASFAVLPFPASADPTRRYPSVHRSDSRRGDLVKCVPIVLALTLSTAAPAFAHHEAIFGPQSSAVLSPTTFFSAQVFDKERSDGEDKHRETTTVYSFGFKPVDKQPLSFAFVVPMTFASGTADASHHGFEDMLVTARYRVDAEPFASSIGFQEGYVM